MASPSDLYIAADAAKLLDNFSSLGLYSEEEQCDGLRAALSEVNAKNYTGRRPPERSFLSSLKDEELFTFVWNSAYFGKKMYPKFAICDSEEFEGESLVIFSLHEDEPHRKVARKKI